MGKSGGDPPDQRTFDIVARVHPSRARIESYCRSIGLSEAEAKRFAGFLWRARTTLAPHDEEPTPPPSLLSSPLIPAEPPVSSRPALPTPPTKTTLTEVGPEGKIFRRYTHQTGHEGWSLGWVARPAVLKTLGLTTLVIVVPATEISELPLPKPPPRIETNVPPQLETGSVKPRSTRPKSKPKPPAGENGFMKFWRDLDPFKPAPSRK